jgi:2-polyprenyl-3-methyl-5-hydroxy-6-metoxy-1,4-benzoquinol methylase
MLGVVGTREHRPDRLWDWLAWLYDRRADGDDELREIVERLSPLLDENHTVLDFGCASGVVACRVAPGVKHVTGLDTSPRMIERARERAGELPNVDFRAASIFDEVLGAFDVVLALHVLHLLPDPAAAVRRIAELVPPGGLLISVTPAGELGGLQRAMLSLVTRLGLLSHLAMMRVPDVEALLQNAGFEVIDADALNGPIPIWYAVARKT